MSGGYYEKGRIVELNMHVIENGSTAWLPARLLTDDDKVELL